MVILASEPDAMLRIYLNGKVTKYFLLYSTVYGVIWLPINMAKLALLKFPIMAHLRVLISPAV